jgi:hypothetical protein
MFLFSGTTCDWALVEYLAGRSTSSASSVHWWRLAGGIMRWKNLACNIKEPQNSIGTCSSTHSFYASDDFMFLLVKQIDIPHFTFRSTCDKATAARSLPARREGHSSRLSQSTTA